MADNTTKTEGVIEEREFTKEQTATQMKMSEGDILKGMLQAAEFRATEKETIPVKRGEDTLFTFRIHALSEQEYEKCRRKATKYVRNKQLGIKMPEDTNNILYRALLIYAATEEEDRKQTWDNKQLWEALAKMGYSVLTGTDVIDAVLLPGEKADVIKKLDRLSGFDTDDFDTLEEAVKN